MQDHRRYVVVAGIVFVLAVACAVATNALVDPYRLYSTRSADERVKPRAHEQTRLLKLYGIARVAPRTLILGNSRAEVGFDPRSSCWPADSAPSFNGAIPGTDIEDALAIFQHALAHGDVRRVVLGVDFPDFLVDSHTPLTDDAWQADPVDLTPLAERLRNVPATLISLTALVDSLTTVARDNAPFSPDLRADGFSPLADYTLLARREGYGALFLQREQELARSFAKLPHALHAAHTNSSTAWRALDRIVTLARTRGIELHLIIYPYHAHLLEIFRAYGLWPLFEQWKRELVRRVAPPADSGDWTPRLWDFSGYDEYTTEPVPALGDRSSQVRWYWEAGHFKHELGERVLAVVFGAQDDELGERLSPANVERRIEAIREQRERYASAQPQAVAAIARLIAAAAR